MHNFDVDPFGILLVINRLLFYIFALKSVDSFQKQSPDACSFIDKAVIVCPSSLVKVSMKKLYVH